MKNISGFKKLVLCVALIGAGTVTVTAGARHAQDATQAKNVMILVSAGTKSLSDIFQVVISNPAGQQLELNVYDASHNLVHQQQVTDSFYAGLFNLSLQEDGKYTVEVSNGHQQWTKELILTTGTAMAKNIQVKQ